MIPTQAAYQTSIEDITAVPDSTETADGGMMLRHTLPRHIQMIISPRDAMRHLEVISLTNPKKPYQVEAWRQKGKRFGR